MEFLKSRLGWADGMGALIFHGQQADVADVYKLTGAFEVAKLYPGTRFADEKLVVGFVLGALTGMLKSYGGGHYLLTAKDGRRQRAELDQRKLKPEQVWIMLPSDHRRVTS